MVRPQRTHRGVSRAIDAAGASDEGEVGPAAVRARAATLTATIAAAPASPNRGGGIVSEA
jgi:hypothetical protein